MQLILIQLKAAGAKLLRFDVVFTIFSANYKVPMFYYMDIMNAKNKKSKTNENNINLVFYSLYDLLFSFPQVSF